MADDAPGPGREFSVRVAKDYLGFSSAHFITFQGHRCEPLHGHNYRVAFRVDGMVDENWYVLDFGVLKAIGRRLVDVLDHRMLLARHNPLIAIEEDEIRVEARYRDRVYRFPRQDVVLLPIPNTTAEMIGSYLADRLLAAFEVDAHVDVRLLREVEVEVEESPGQSAVCRRRVGL